MGIKEFNEILVLHKKWKNNEDGGVRADLDGADLQNANLRNADLQNAILHNAILCGADLCRADLHNADLQNANLRNADLRNADLYRANLCGANLQNAILQDADLQNANLRNADLQNAILCGANLQNAILQDAKYANTIINLQCPGEGEFIGWKKCENNSIVKLLILADSKRSSGTSRKCRASKVRVLQIFDCFGLEIESAFSTYSDDFIYKKDEIIEISDFDENRWNECSKGIHFFITKNEAKQY